MKKSALQNYVLEDAGEYLNKIPFFKALLLANKEQHDLLVSRTEVVELGATEIIIHQGSVDKIFYSVVQGKLDVYAEKVEGKEAIGHVSAGQVVGGLSLISQKPSTALWLPANLMGWCY